MKRLAEICSVCSKSMSRFQASKMICHRCGEVVCRQCIVARQGQNQIGLYAENVKEHTIDGEIGKKLQGDNNY
ncbi:MAG: hypothetical protein CM1200mP28_05420 [Deltaproteobacteria bacterium]|nr:MAG: hypothetical protein CM1200mP28_05420 [Deltaproteobacteria bacterium]